MTHKNKHGLNDFQAAVLGKIQSGFPIESRPYEVHATELESTENEVFSCVNELKEAGIIRRLGAIFDANHLGYTSALCAVSVPVETDVDKVADFINQYINVTHNYERPGHYNIWFTLITPSLFEARVILNEIAVKTGYSDILHLPTKRLYKIRVDFNVGGKDKDGAEKSGKSAASAQVKPDVPATPAVRKPYIDPASIVPEAYSEIDKALVRELQSDLSGHLRPFEFVAQQTHGIDGFELGERAVLQRVRNWKFNGTIRRFGAAIRHHRVGYSHNAMCVWDVPDDIVTTVAPLLADRKTVSHCYERPRQETWPSNLYTMVHGNSAEECEAIVDQMFVELAEAGLDDRVERPCMLYSTREFKKVSMRYFMEDMKGSEG